MTKLTKPVRRTTHANVPYGVTPQIVVTLYPGGIIGLREQRHRREYTLGIGTLYVQAMLAQTRIERAERKKMKKQAKVIYARHEKLTN